MRNALAIAAREFEEKRFVAYAAVAFAILPFVLSVIPGINGKSPQETIALSSLIFATGFGVALAVMTGASFVGRDLSDNRLSFYFSRPVASASIWFGKLTAGLLMVVGCFAIIIAPAWIMVGEFWKSFWSLTLAESTKYVLVIALALFLIAHVISTFARSRSPLIVIDFAAAVACGLTIRYLTLLLATGWAIEVMKWMGIALALALAVGIVAGGAWQLERGRTDRRRNHRALSQFLWGTMAAALLLAAGYVGWVLSVTPGDLSIALHVTRSTSGPFAVITGKSPGRGDYLAGFLLNTDDGSEVRIGNLAESAVRYTRDGRSVVVTRMDGGLANVWIYRRGLRKPIDTGLNVDSGSLFVSDDGGRIATVSRANILSVYDVVQKRSLASVMLPEGGYMRAFFVSPDVVRLYLNTKEKLKIVELDVRARGLRETGSLATTTFAVIYPDASAAHMLVRPERGADLVTLNDARTGALITTLASGTHVKTARFLRDGRIAIVDGAESATVLHILSAAGIPQRDIPLGAAKSSIFVGDDGARCVMAVETAAEIRQLIAVDLDRGVIAQRVDKVVWVPTGTLDPRPPVEPLRDVFYGDSSNKENHIVSWNPATGGKRRII
jgi:hypothetical protein